MSVSKLINIAGLLIVVALTSACKPHTTEDGMNGPYQKGDSDSAPGTTFSVVKIEGRGDLDNVAINPDWQVVSKARYSFTACILNQTTKTPARGHKFRIEKMNAKPGEPTTVDHPVTHDDGCLEWTEDLTFDFYVNESAPIQLTRRIYGDGAHNGYVTARIYVDPWALGDNARDSFTPQVQSSANFKPPVGLVTDSAAIEKLLHPDKSQAARLWVSKVSTKMIDRKYFDKGQTTDLELTMDVAVQWRKNGLVNYTPLNSGRFEVFAQLVVTDTGPKQEDKVILTAGRPSSTAVIKDGKLFTTLRTNILTAVPIGNVSLVLQIKPRGFSGPMTLQDYQGVFELGNYSELDKPPESRPWQPCVEGDEKNCNYENYLAGAKNAKDLKDAKYAFDNEVLYFDDLSLKFVAIAPQPAETSTKRTVAYAISTCITNRITGQKIANMPFRITYLKNFVDAKGHVYEDPNPDGQIQKSLTTNDMGCLEWMEQISHDYYRPERFIPRRVQITMGDGTAGTILSYIVNPWDYGWAFGFDLKRVDPNLLIEWLDKPKIPSRLFIDGYDYHTQKFLYSFDDYLNLTVHKTVWLRLYPKVLRYSGILNARKTTEDLRDGIYLLKVALQKNFLDPAVQGLSLDRIPETLRVKASMTNEQKDQSVLSDKDDDASYIHQSSYVTSSTTLVRVVDGAIITPVELKVSDLRLMRMRANFLIEIEPVDERLVKEDPVFQAEYDKVLNTYWEKLKANAHQQGDLSYADMVQNYNLKKEALRNELQTVWTNLNTMMINKPPISSMASIPADLKDMMDPVLKALDENDFFNLQLPPCEPGCDRFVAKITDKNDPEALAPRTFVGPIILLSNAYSDAVRATDSLDEVCKKENPRLTAKQRDRLFENLREPFKGLYKYGSTGVPVLDKDDPSKNIGMGEEDWLNLRKKEVDPLRQNNQYRYSEYYGSLSYLCFKSVDELIADDEVTQEEVNKGRNSKLASLDNFTKSQNFDFGVLNSNNAKDYGNDGQSAVSAEQIAVRMNAHHVIQAQAGNPGQDVWNSEVEDSGANAQENEPLIRPEQLSGFFFNSVNAPDFENLKGERLRAVCSLLSETVVENLKAFKYDPSTSPGGKAPAGRAFEQFLFDQARPQDLASQLFLACIGAQGSQPIFIDEKLRIKEIVNDEQMYRGGLQININVGENFSLSYSNSASRSIEYLDAAFSSLGILALVNPLTAGGEGAVVAGAEVAAEAAGISGGIAAGVAKGATDTAVRAAAGRPGIIRRGLRDYLPGALFLTVGDPFSNKSANTLSDSDGTSVSNQVPLTAQIARFSIPLTKYEQCRGYHFDSEFIKKLFETNIPLLPAWPTLDLTLQNSEGRRLYDVLTRGVFLCSGNPIVKPADKPDRVAESFYYFTQYVPEGDMLDQWELLNHPWLLRLRGDRDFGLFINAIKGQEVVSQANFGYGITSNPETRPVAWPLDHLSTVYQDMSIGHAYRQVTASMPGYYTKLPPEAQITAFPMGQRLVRVSQDINGEVCNVPANCPGMLPQNRSRPGVSGE